MYHLVNADHNDMAVHLKKVTVRDFKKWGISNAMDGSDDGILWNGSEVDGNVSECEENEGTNCEDGDSDTD